MSLVETAAKADSLQLLLAFDDDDEQGQQYFVDKIAPRLDDNGVNYTSLVFERMGYTRLNEYVNGLAEQARGRWMMFWNDDAVMETQGWDREIVKHDGNFSVLRMPTHNEHPYAIFPIVPSEWYDIFGYLSDHQISDAWISQIAYMLDIMTNIDVKVVHDRHDLTGNNLDETFKERQMFEGNPSDPRDFNHVSWRQRRWLDADRICRKLQVDGRDMSWFLAVKEGRQDPWEKMMSAEYDPNKQIARFS